MVPQEAVGVGVYYGMDMADIELEEIAVVTLLDERVRAVVSPVLDVVYGVVPQRNGIRHRDTSYSDLSGFRNLTGLWIGEGVHQ